MIRQSMPSGLTRGCERFGEKDHAQIQYLSAIGRKTGSHFC